MENKAIQNVKIEDFIGKWASSDNVIKLFVNSRGYLTIGGKRYEGIINVEYISDCEVCVNCLKLSIDNYSFFIKQIDQRGFYLTVEGGEMFLAKMI